VSAYYCRSVLFAGLWPLSSLDYRHGAYGACRKWFLKAVYFSWFAVTFVELVIRGAARSPLPGVRWSAYTDHRAPSVFD